MNGSQDWAAMNRGSVDLVINVQSWDWDEPRRKCWRLERTTYYQGFSRFEIYTLA